MYIEDIWSHLNWIQWKCWRSKAIIGLKCDPGFLRRSSTGKTTFRSPKTFLQFKADREKNDRHNLFPNLKVKNDCFSSETIFRSLELSSIENVPFPFCVAAYFFLVLCPDFLARIQNLFSLKMVIKIGRRKNGLFLTQIT